jgi:phosphatidylserine/phosphatidylglycerophosphate/cardiolipin synthase-like enzyme
MQLAKSHTTRRALCLLVALVGHVAIAVGAVTSTPEEDARFAAVLREAFAGRQRRGEDSAATNRVAIINDGYDALLLRVHLIRQAKRSIDIQTFIWTNDECGRLMICELIEAARRGVRVRIIADQLVSEKDPATMAFLATVHPNLEVRHYRPAASRIAPSKVHTILSAIRSLKDVNQRMHNKTMIFDGVALITGGRNIENTYFNHSTEMNFKDRDALVIGPVVSEASESFEEFWTYRWSIASRDLLDVRAVMDKGGFRRYDRRADYDFGPFFKTLDAEEASSAELEKRFGRRLHSVKRAQFVADRPGKNRSLWLRGQGQSTRALTDALASATETVLMQTPYLVLSGKAFTLFRNMKQRAPGLRIAVSSNSFGSTDNLLAYSANYRMRARYIDGLGLEVYEYMPYPGSFPVILPQHAELATLAQARITEGKQTRQPFLCVHAKSFVVDDRIAFVGSFNLDPRSENLNTEVGLLIEDPVVTAELKADILNDMSGRNSWVIGKRAIPLHLAKVNALFDGISGLLPIDLWPIQNTTSFEWVPEGPEVRPGHPDFQRRYREAGDFPGAVGMLSRKEIVTRLYKAVGPVLTPML